MAKSKYSHQFIIVFLSLAAFLHNILMNGANNVILSSLQKEFYLTSKETGIYVSVYDIGSLTSTIIVSFASARGSKPRWIAFGMCALFIGCMIDIIPHFIKPLPADSLTSSPTSSSNNGTSSVDVSSLANAIELCNASVVTIDESSSGLGLLRYDRALLPSSRSSRDISGTSSPVVTEVVNKNDNSLIFGIFQLKHVLYLGNCISGFSSASLTTITFSYIEDIAPASRSAIYESIYYAVGAFGVGVGFIITSKFLQIHTDINTMQELPAWLNISHPNWIGAWWLPFLLFGFISLILAVIIFTFPKKLDNSAEDAKDAQRRESVKSSEMVALKPIEEGKQEKKEVQKEKEPESTDLEEDHNMLKPSGNGGFRETIQNTGSLLSLNYVDQTNVAANGTATGHATSQQQELIDSTFVLLKKPVYLLIVIATAIEGLLQNSFLAFAALFLEYQYRLASGTASLVLGMLSIPPLMIGGILSGYIVKRFKYHTQKCCKFLLVVLAINIVVYSGFMVFCREPKMIRDDGLGGPPLLQPNTFGNSSNSFYSVASAEQCNCNRKLFKPVCLKESQDVFYQTPCLAGCTEFDKNADQFFNCTQAPSTFLLKKQQQEAEKLNNYFISGLCPTEGCELRLIISYSCIFFLMLLNALTFLPYLKVTIGVIDSKEMNSIGLGIKQFAMNGFGTIPGPILFGTVIDSTCTYWHTDQNEQRVCKIYDNEQFAFGFGMLGIGFKTLCFLLVLLSSFILRAQSRKRKAAAKNASSSSKQRQIVAN